MNNMPLFNPQLANERLGEDTPDRECLHDIENEMVEKSVDIEWWVVTAEKRSVKASEIG